MVCLDSITDKVERKRVKDSIEKTGKNIIEIDLNQMECFAGNLLQLGEKGNKIIVVSQFTLHAKTKKGNRPSYINAAKPELAIPLYEKFTDFLRKESVLNVYTGKFGADMKVSLINDGPVTIILDSKEKNF